MTASKTEEKALAIFQEKQITPAMQTAVLDMDPDFASRTEEEQREVLQMLIENAEKTLENVKSRFQQVDLIHAGTNLFKLPPSAETGDETTAKEFEAVILDQYLTKAYWEKRMGEGQGTPPDCASLDGYKPYTRNPVSADCISCPYNKFGTGVDQEGRPTRGKRCRDQKRLVLHLEGHRLPVRLTLSTMNIKNLDSFLSELSDQNLTMSKVRTRFRAVESKNAQGVKYTGVDLSIAEKLSIDEMLRIKRETIDAYGDQFRIGAIEAGEGDSGSDRTPSKEELEEEGQAVKAAAVM